MQARVEGDQRCARGALFQFEGPGSKLSRAGRPVFRRRLCFFALQPVFKDNVDSVEMHTKMLKSATELLGSTLCDLLGPILAKQLQELSSAVETFNGAFLVACASSSCIILQGFVLGVV